MEEKEREALNKASMTASKARFIRLRTEDMAIIIEDAQKFTFQATKAEMGYFHRRIEALKAITVHETNNFGKTDIPKKTIPAINDGEAALALPLLGGCATEAPFDRMDAVLGYFCGRARDIRSFLTTIATIRTREETEENLQRLEMARTLLLRVVITGELIAHKLETIQEDSDLGPTQTSSICSWTQPAHGRRRLGTSRRQTAAGTYG